MLGGSVRAITATDDRWRDGRVVECGGLESRCTACRYRGFESLSLRLDSAPVTIVAGAESPLRSTHQEIVMRGVRNYWPHFALTAAAAAYAYSLDARDGTIAWPLLLAGTIIAGAGFVGGGMLIQRVSSRHDHC